jgi:hypothetical protein
VSPEIPREVEPATRVGRDESSSSAGDEIRRRLLDYCRGVDRWDLALVRSAYHSDALDHHTGFDGGIDEFILWLDQVLGQFEGTMHFLTNQVIEVAQDRAVSESYVMAVHWGSPADDPRLNFTCGTRYVDKWEAREGTWGILERWAAREWTRSDAGAQVAKAGAGPQGARGKQDLLYDAQAWLAAH